MNAVSDTVERERLAHVRPLDWRNPAPARRYKLLVIGAGPAGLVAAHTAATLGARVALVERTFIGGTCMNVGCVPSKALIRTARLYAQMRNALDYGACVPSDVNVDFAAAMARMRQLRARISRSNSITALADTGIDVFLGHARFVAGDAVDVEGARLRFDKAIIATGSRPDTPDIPRLNELELLSNENIFDLTELPRRLLVIGGGPLGCELAQVFSRFGAQTIIAQKKPLFLPKEERDAAQLLSDSFARDGLEVRLNTRVTAVGLRGGEHVVEMVSDDYHSQVTVDAVLTGVGRLPNIDGLEPQAAGVETDEHGGIRVDDFLRTSNRRIFSAGDVCMEHKFTDVAEATARIAVRNALFPGNQRVSALTIPWCTYTDPEIAHVGLYVRQANRLGIPVRSFTVPMHQIDRAILDSEQTGYVKIHVAQHSDRILGATIVARHAGEMINEITLAMVHGIGLNGLAKVIHAYPTQAQAIHKAASACNRTRVTPVIGHLMRWWLQR